MCQCQKTKIKKAKAFCNWSPSRIHLNFPNGNYLSTIWGAGSYTENHNRSNHKELKIEIGNFQRGRKDVLDGFWVSDNVEIMFSCGEKLKKRILRKYNVGENDPIGYLEFTEWLEIVNLLNKEKTNLTPNKRI